MPDADRRTDNETRDRVGEIAQTVGTVAEQVDQLPEWTQRVDEWRKDVDRRIGRGHLFIGIALGVFLAGFIVTGVLLLTVFHQGSRETQRASDASAQAASAAAQAEAVLIAFQDGRAQNLRAACSDAQDEYRQLRALGRDLGGPDLARVISRRFPPIDCHAYVKDGLSKQGRKPLDAYAHP